MRGSAPSRWLPVGAGICLLFVVFGGAEGQAETPPPLTPEQVEFYGEAQDLHKASPQIARTEGEHRALDVLFKAHALLEGDDHRIFVNRRAKIAISIGASYGRLGESDEAERWFQSALEAGRITGKDTVLLNSMVGLARVLIHRDEATSALLLLDEALEIAEARNRPLDLGLIRYQRGSAFDLRGDHANALDQFLEAARTLAPLVEQAPVGPDPTEAQRFYVASRARVATILASLGFPEAALAEITTVLNHPEAFLPTDETRFLLAAAHYAREAGEVERAQDFTVRARAAFEMHGPLSLAGKLLMVEGQTAWLSGDTPSGCHLLELAQDQLTDESETAALRTALLLRSECELEAGRTSEAFAAAGQARALWAQAGANNDWESWRAIGKARAALGRADAVDAYAMALEGLDASIGALQLDALALGLEGSARGIYDESAELLLAQGRVEEALTVLERGRSRLLLASVLGLGQTPTSAATPDRVLPSGPRCPVPPAPNASSAAPTPSAACRPAAGGPTNTPPSVSRGRRSRT
ncbi:MAG: tetratricopeptide repeat protein [Proteobacteria bacterium]|nr:tetratricopeptide repeat protein [Pseudomonadota bacterium]